MKKTWTLEDHLCRSCGGRILRCASGQGMSPGGNPLFKCADCGTAGTGMSPDILCWCGFSHKHNHGTTAYVCAPFSILEKHPELKHGFQACGCNPDRGEVGVMLESDFRKRLI